MKNKNPFPFDGGTPIFLENQKKLQGAKKLWNKFKVLSKKDSFNKELSKIKKECGISDGDAGENQWTNNKAGESLMSLMGKYGFYVYSWQHLFIHYAQTGKVLALEDMHWEEEGSVAITTTIIEESVEPFSKDIRDHMDMIYPIHIRITPYASGRDIHDYIDRTYTSLIEPLQSQFRKGKSIKRDNTRNKKIEERNDFIYENRNKTTRQLLSLVMEKFGSELTPDMSNISKTIADEEERRK
jgi:hypothetical protein